MKDITRRVMVSRIAIMMFTGLSIHSNNTISSVLLIILAVVWMVLGDRE